MLQPGKLRALGYWSGPLADRGLPDVKTFVDGAWDAQERDTVTAYLERGFVWRVGMGYSRCRLCEIENGDLDLTDGFDVWPSGLAHYLEAHAVRLPSEFVQHVIARIEAFEQSERDDTWWREQRAAGT